MFELDEKLETELDLDGTVYPVNMAFNNIMTLFKLLENKWLRPDEKIQQGLHLLLDTHLEIENNEQVAVFHYLLDHFVNSDQKNVPEVDLEGNPIPIKKQAASQDLRHDASYIYNSFRQAYNINLFEEHGKLDWREFLSLLRGLPEDTEYKKVLDIRTRPYQKGKGTGEANRKLKEAKKRVALPGTSVE
ncbi:MAG: bacteriophage Gp15 family protein [Turicibacter sp.]|nr:bacteriophage Gp15 family protein [Turicibacter sp.]